MYTSDVDNSKSTDSQLVATPKSKDPSATNFVKTPKVAYAYSIYSIPAELLVLLFLFSNVQLLRLEYHFETLVTFFIT